MDFAKEPALFTFKLETSVALSTVRTGLFFLGSYELKKKMDTLLEYWEEKMYLSFGTGTMTRVLEY